MQPGQHRQHVEDRSATVGFDDRDESADDTQGAEVVRLHLQPDVLERPGQQSRPRGRSRIVDQHVHVGGQLGSAVHRGWIGDIQFDGFDTGHVDVFGSACGGVHLCSPLDELGCEPLTKSPVGAGDQSGDLVAFHRVLPLESELPRLPYESFRSDRGDARCSATPRAMCVVIRRLQHVAYDTAHSVVSVSAGTARTPEAPGRCGCDRTCTSDRQGSAAIRAPAPRRSTVLR